MDRFIKISLIHGRRDEIRVGSEYTSVLRTEALHSSMQSGHARMIVLVPPKVSISDLMGALKGRSAIRMFRHYPNLKTKPCWGNHFWADGYGVDTAGVDEEMIRQYVLKLPIISGRAPA